MNSNFEFKKLNTKEAYRSIYPFIQMLSPYLDEKTFLSYADTLFNTTNYHLFAMYDNKKILGICALWFGVKFYCGKYAELDNFVISPEYRSQGVGTIFYDFLEKEVEKENCETIMLDAYLINQAGHRFYQKMGFEAKGYHFIKKLL